MKTSLPLNKANEEAILSALKLANGRATTHTYTTYGELKVLEAEAKSRLDKLGITEKDQEGVKFRHQSGEQLPNAYRNHAQTTNVELTRQGKQWVLTGVDRSSTYAGSKPKHALILPENLAAYAEKAPRGLHVAVEAESESEKIARYNEGKGFSIPKIDQKQNLDQVVAERQEAKAKLSDQIKTFCDTPTKIAALDRELEQAD